MKTAMQMALDRIEMLYIEKDNIHWEMFKNDCMEKEKEQIIDAYCEGFKDGSEGAIILCDEYLNKLYN
jgi:hypothetical protein